MNIKKISEIEKRKINQQKIKKTHEINNQSNDNTTPAAPKFIAKRKK